MFLYNKILTDKKDYCENSKKSFNINSSKYKNELLFLK